MTDQPAAHQPLPWRFDVSHDCVVDATVKPVVFRHVHFFMSGNAAERAEADANMDLMLAISETAAQRDRLRQTMIDAEKRCIELLQERDRMAERNEMLKSLLKDCLSQVEKMANVLATGPVAGPVEHLATEIQAVLDEARQPPVGQPVPPGKGDSPEGAGR